MSSQECEIVWCSQKATLSGDKLPCTVFRASSIPHHTGKLAWLTLGNSRDSLRHPSQFYTSTNFSTGTRVKLHAPHIILKRERIPRILLKRWATSPQPSQVEPSLSNWYVRGTLNLLPHVQGIPRLPDAKESQISLQWLECRLFFHLTI